MLRLTEAECGVTVTDKFAPILVLYFIVQCMIREYGSTLYAGITREKNGGRIKRVH